MKQEKPKVPKLSMTARQQDTSAVGNLTRKLLRAPGGFQANMSRLNAQQRLMVLEEMKKEREEKLEKIREKEAKKQEMQEIDKELAEAQRSEMAVWKRKK